jgi:polyisoprenoid-binding protein YceI
MHALTSRVSGAAALCLLAQLSAAPAAATYSVDSGRSTLTVTVGKGGLFKAFGHDHLIRATRLSGLVRFDEDQPEGASVDFVVDAASLSVIDPGESDAGRQSIQLTMLSDKVMDVQRFPSITFTSGGVSSAVQTAEGRDLVVQGVLRLHGVDRPVRVPVHVAIDRGVLRVRGEVSLRQTEFGITPVTVAGGMVRVKDELTISFEIIAVHAAGGGAYTIS